MIPWEGHSDSGRVMNKDIVGDKKKSNICILSIVTSRDRCNSVPHGESRKKYSHKVQMPWWKKILEFYKSPAAKFWANAVSC